MIALSTALLLQGGGGAAQNGGGSDGTPDLTGMLFHHLLDGGELEFQLLGIGPIIHLDQWAIPPIFGIDLSPTKHVVFLLLAALLCLAVFIPMARTARRKHASHAPSGLANAMEAMILYFRDEVVRRNIGHGADAYTGYILTLFFFILFMNLLGLMPYGSTATANFMVTGALALVTFVVVEFTGMRSLGFKGYMGTIFFVPKGLSPAMSVFMLIILTPVELMSKFAKPFALMIRLFANMVAGHTLVLSLLGMIFIFASVGPLRWGIAGASIVMVWGIMLLEVFVAFLQAYIFAMLTAVFVGLIRHAH